MATENAADRFQEWSQLAAAATTPERASVFIRYIVKRLGESSFAVSCVTPVLLEECRLVASEGNAADAIAMCQLLAETFAALAQERRGCSSRTSQVGCVFRFDGTGEPAIVTIEGVYEDLKALREVGKIKPLLEFPVFRTIFGTRSQRPRPDQDIWVEMSSTKCLYYVYLVGDVSDAEVLFAAVNAAGGKGFSITCDDQEINAAALRHFGSW